ncbi:hypothetical protein KKB40_06300 [Patescibacteria group bacterium]|nr:hypothetical protein [Patescibacteria group bacterium]
MKNIKKQPSGIKLGPSFITKGNKKMMTMTRPIDAYDFGFDQMISSLEAHIEVDSTNAMFANLFASTLNSLISDILNYFQNRVRIKIGKDITITSVPTAKAKLKKYFDVEIKTLIGDKGYKELKKLDEIRGDFQHGNDRYFVDYRVNNKPLDTVEKLNAYCLKIKKILVELDDRLEKISPSYQVTETIEDRKTTISMKAVGHSFDYEKIKINKTEDK